MLEKLKRQGLEEWPSVATGDGAMGFWRAFRKVCTSTGNSVVGCIRQVMFSINFPKAVRAKLKKNFKIFGWQRRRKKQRKPLTILTKSMKLNFPKQRPV